MTAVTSLAKLSVVNVITGMTGNTGARVTFYTFYSFRVTGFTIYLLMLTCKLKLCLLIMIKTPYLPTVRIVAGITVFTESLFMNIILFMATKAGDFGSFVSIG